MPWQVGARRDEAGGAGEDAWYGGGEQHAPGTKDQDQVRGPPSEVDEEGESPPPAGWAKGVGNNLPCSLATV